MTQGHAVPRIAVVGCGYWGKNLVRNFAELGALHSVCDADPVLAAEFASRFGVPALDLDDTLESDCNGVAIASPAALHVGHALRALSAGKHVFVEKPLALTVDDGNKVCAMAETHDRVLMVGHVLRYHPMVREIVRLVRSGAIGKVRRVVSNRLSLGKIRTDEDVIWSFAPHDISVVLAILEQMPLAVSAHGANMLTPGVLDAAVLHLAFAEKVTAQIHVSWLHPFKEQKLSVIGSEGYLVFDDTLPWDRKLVLLPHKVTLQDGWPRVIKADPVVVLLPQSEPLREECTHFLDCIRQKKLPLTNATEALQVLSVLEAASESLKCGRDAAPQ